MSAFGGKADTGCCAALSHPKRTSAGPNVPTLHCVSLNRCIWGRVCGGASSSGYLALRRCCRSGRARNSPSGFCRIGVLMPYAKDNPEGLARLAAFIRELQQLGWTDGRNVKIEYRWDTGDLILE